MSLFLAAYDISDNRRRARVAKVLTRYGTRVQESVFEVWIEPGDMGSLRFELGSLLRASDAFDIYPIDERGTRRRMRWQRPVEDWGGVVVL
ncbi:MAG: CRISPR-associated endonuclease Cas2 [Phycisphaeraceae bacterium]|nr:CRISPR-associated endonuclease Cas2 [Phycisphaeraceae bacterium]